MTVIDDYLATLGEPQREALDRVRRVSREVSPEAEDVISYGMPTLRYDGKYLIHFAAFKNHLSIFPGTIRFTAEEPVPAAVIQAIVSKRLAEIAGE